MHTYRQPLHGLALAFLAVLAIASSGSSGAPASTAVVLPQGAVQPLERQRLVARRISATLRLPTLPN